MSVADRGEPGFLGCELLLGLGFCLCVFRALDLGLQLGDRRLELPAKALAACLGLGVRLAPVFVFERLHVILDLANAALNVAH